MSKIAGLYSLVLKNGKLVENYFFMTALQLISTAFGILIYPFVIRVLGAESYGIYVFSYAIVAYFISFVSFGFQLPALKSITENRQNKEKLAEVISTVFSAKFLLAIFSGLIFLPVMYYVPLLNAHKWVFIITFVQLVAEVLNPVWFFQAIEKMKIVTYFQLAFKMLSVPFLFLLLKSPNDIELYAIIVTVSVVLPAICMLFYMRFKEQIKLILPDFNSIKALTVNALPYFGSNLAGTIKQESVPIIIGSILGMQSVAIYDLANKLILLPRMLTSSINTALYPKISEKSTSKTIRKIIRYEWIIGFVAIFFVAAFGYWIIYFLGGENMLDAYLPAIILSITVLVWLVVGSYIYFIFLPQNKNSYVAKNQIVALISFAVFLVPAYFFNRSVTAIAVALAISGLFEIAYCKYIIKKHQLL